MRISVDEARKVARLARIRVADDELTAISEELSDIIGFMEQIASAPVDGVQPMTSVTPMRLQMRPDKVTSGNCRDAVLSVAPDARNGFFVVPKVVE